MKMDWNKLVVALIATCPVVALAQDTPADPVAEYEQLLRDISGLQARNALVRRQIQQQEQELADLRGAIEQVPELENQLPPLLISMVDGLEQFVDLDLPFLEQERDDRVANLRLFIEDNISDAQKLRRILEAWSIEVEYGNSFQTEQHPVTLPDGSERNADIVVLGRIGLMFQSADDEAITGLWDAESKEWVILGSEHRNPVRTAIRMARNQVAPDLTLLPVPAPSP
jgi:Protein of unknown function (DUF3450)